MHSWVITNEAGFSSVQLPLFPRAFLHLVQLCKRLPYSSIDFMRGRPVPIVTIRRASSKFDTRSSKQWPPRSGVALAITNLDVVKYGVP